LLAALRGHAGTVPPSLPGYRPERPEPCPGGAGGGLKPARRGSYTALKQAPRRPISRSLEEASMHNRALSELFEQMADLMEVQGDVAFKVNAYRRAARALDAMQTDVVVLRAEKRLR